MLIELLFKKEKQLIIFYEIRLLHGFIKYLLKICLESGAMLDAETISVNKTDTLPLLSLQERGNSPFFKIHDFTTFLII